PVPSLAHLAPAAADVPRIKLHGRATKSRACDAIRRTPDAGARTCALPEPPPPTAPSVAPLRSVAADVSRLKLHSRPAKKRPFEAIRLTPDATAGYGPRRAATADRAIGRPPSISTSSAVNSPARSLLTCCFRGRFLSHSAAEQDSSTSPAGRNTTYEHEQRNHLEQRPPGE